MTAALVKVGMRLRHLVVGVSLRVILVDDAHVAYRLSTDGIEQSEPRVLTREAFERAVTRGRWIAVGADDLSAEDRFNEDVYRHYHEWEREQRGEEGPRAL